jgi:hypothetical protein
LGPRWFSRPVCLVRARVNDRELRAKFRHKFRQ